MDIFWEDGASVESITFDATLRETLSGAAAVTEHAVETGANVADHVRPEVRKASFECFVSNSPADVPETQMFGVEGRIDAVELDTGTMPALERGAQRARAASYERSGRKVAANVLRFDGSFDRCQRVYEALDELRRSGTLLDVSTSIAQLERMVITSLSAPREAKSGDGITFALEMVQVRLAESQLVEVPDPVEPRGRPTTEAGATSTSESELPESLWASMFL